MSRNTLALLTGCLLILASTLDAGLTLHFNPSLSREANPLVSVLGLGRMGLLVGNIQVIGLMLTLLWMYRTPHHAMRTGRGDTPWAHTARELFGEPFTKTELLRAIFLQPRRPKNWFQFGRFVGFWGSWWLIGARFSAAFTWFALYQLHWKSFEEVRSLTKIFGYATFELIMGTALSVIMLHYYVDSEFRLTNHPDSRLTP